ncbi:hypothetical protein J4E86_002570 [Alternaria arbusti]|uniref:uncharacterized protein n=1 Tax=Alternaria arbusti TaxID=232088 RepID=UPI002220B3C1|nr:uncharacterized protein J4E86_002570 [Alternaria arbusti]KAI4960943.1 hypothetical protein J4E86_002570 [Alternaria arbusti]
MATPQQGQYQGHVPHQHQNVSQQRQVPNGQQQSSGQQQNFGQAQQRPAQPQQQPLNPFANYDPQLASFILEKPRNATSWEDATPEQQHVALQELHSELHKFRRNHNNVKKAMNEIPSPNCRRIINELVEDQNVELARIASVVNKWRSVNRRERQLVRVDIILETEPSGFQEPMQARPVVGGAGNGPQDANKNKQGQQFPNPSNNPGQNMPQQQRPPLQQQHQQHPGAPNLGQHPPPPGNMNPMPGPQNPPPPPPPPGMSTQHDGGRLPPPPNVGPGQHMPGVPLQHLPPPPGQPHGPPFGQMQMPGAFPDQMQFPLNGMRHVPGLNPDHLRHQKKNHRVRRDVSGSSSDSDSWESESEDSSFVNIEHDHIDADRRGRGRQRPGKRSKKTQKHRSLSKARGLSRSRSRSRARKNNVDPYVAKTTRRHRTSDIIDDQRNGRHSPESFTTDSSRSSHNKVTPVHIHLSTNNVVEDRTRSGNASPVGLSNEKKKRSGKYPSSHGMARETSNSSSERGSGTESMNTTSVHTADDGIFDTPIRRRPSFTHVHRRQKVSYGRKSPNMFGQPHPSHIYDEDVDHRRVQKVRYHKETVDDYPHPRSPRAHMHEPESYFDDYPVHTTRPSLPNRRATMANPPNIHNPFAQPHFPPKPVRASSYLADRHEQGYSYPQPRTIGDQDELDARYALNDIHAALEHIQDKKERSARRSNMMGRRDSAFQYEDDEWHARVPLSGRRGGYGGY